MEVKRFGFGLDKYDKWLNAQKAKASGPVSDTGFQPVPGAVESGKRTTADAQHTSHGLEARVTDARGLPPTARADDDLNADKTTQGESTDAEWPIPEGKLRRKLSVPSQGRLYYVRYALKMGWTIDEVHQLTKIDPWFLAQMLELVEFEEILASFTDAVSILNSGGHYFGKDIEPVVHQAKQWGYSDVQLASVWRTTPARVRRMLQEIGLKPVYKIVDTCAAEFEASTPYYYSTYETPYHKVGIPGEDMRTWFDKTPGAVAMGGAALMAEITEDEIRLTQKPKVIIIGGGPNRIGQGIEFDYCCVHAAFACRELGLESVMINSNPETVSTDYDTSDLLFFEPLTHEDILNICERLNGKPFTEKGGLVKGVIVQFGGQTPLNLAKGLKEAGVPILGTSVESLDAAGDREQFRDLLQKLGLKQPENGIARSVQEARDIARRIGYPVLVRPSFVLGGRAMEIVYGEDQLNYYMANAVDASTIADAPILVDKFLDNATECDVDCLADYPPVPVPLESQMGKVPPDEIDKGQAIVIGVMEHIEEAGIHSGDSACSLPPFSLSKEIIEKLKVQSKALAKALRVRGLMNVQYAIKDDEIYLIEVNPRASRTVPFVGKATGQQWAKIAAKVMCGKTLAEMGIKELPDPKHISVKEVVFPFSKFPGVDIILGPEMRSTGEVMGIDTTFGLAFGKSQLAAGTVLPLAGTAYLSVRNEDKQAVIPIARKLADCGFKLVATGGTYDALKKAGVAVERINKLAEGRPHIGDLIKNGKLQLMINTPTKKGPQTDEGKIRAMAVQYRVPIFTTLTAGEATAEAIAAMQKNGWGVRPLQSYHA
ncbi:carbamoyl-phosphate synthase large subunit [Humisphaera borealis]|uniref:Carbamoyl phosphate synthase pyrimidine-specific large chain n=2 Tax=Humisphaera borealis TaxID=2807512 RepID=A0A7M2X3S6_9BACT|nr:carbamoyl-phosphate synthase large subunit [Humisphaera borealis]